MNPRFLVLGLALLALTLTAPALAQLGGGNPPPESQNLPSSWKPGDTICDPGGFGNWPDFNAFSRSGTPVTCRLQPSDETPFGGHAPEGLDATNCAGEARAQDNQRLNVSVVPSATANRAQCFITIRFPIQETIPRNMTVLSAVLTIYADFGYYNNNPSRTAQLDRNLTIRNVFPAWTEETANYERFPAGTGYNTSTDGPMDVNTGFHGSANPFTGGGGSSQNAGNVLGSFPLPKSFRTTDSVACAYEYRPGVERLRGCEAHTHGWIILDEPNANCTDSAESCKQVFFSSGARTPQGEPYEACLNAGGPTGQAVGNRVMAHVYCWPKLDVFLDPNRAIPRNLTFHYNTSRPHDRWSPDIALRAEEAIWMPGNVPFNISIDGEDAKGRIKSGSFEIRNKTGVLYAREDFKNKVFNTSSFDIRRDPGDHSRLWTVRAFDLPEDRYYVNVTLLDVDNHRLDLNMTGGPVLWIDRTPPTMSALKWPASVPQADPVNLSVTMADERRVDAAFVDITLPAGNTLTFKMKPGENFEGGKRSDWYFVRGWTDPGNYTMRIRVNDTLGNANTSGPLVFRVVDVKLPKACGGRVVAPDVRFGVYVQEAGGKVRVDGCATDETALVVTTTCISPTGQNRQFAMPATTEGHHVADFTAEEPGRHDCAIRARDTDSNVVEVLPFTLLVEPAAAPRASAFVPATGGFANATPVASVTWTDLNLDRASLRIESSVDGGPFERAVPGLFGAGIETRAVFEGHTFEAGDTVTLRAFANDTLGHASHPVTWSFRIDAKAPRINATLTGDRAPGPVASFVKRDAKIATTTSDDLSGVARIEAKWTRVASSESGLEGAETPWREVTGDLAVVDPQVDRGAATYAVSVRAVDNVGNAAPAEEIRFVLDPDAPVVRATPAAGELRLDVADPGSGLASLVAGSRLVGDPTFNVVDLQAEISRAPQGGRFVVPTAIVSKGETMEYYVTAVDALGNRFAIGSPLQPSRLLGVNHKPILEVEGPENDSELQGALELRWKATDEDGDDIRVDVTLRPIVLEEGETLASNAPSRGLVGWDSREAPDGVYVVEVRARDAESTAVSFTRFVVNNTGTGIGRLVAPSGRVEYLQTIRFEVTLYRPVVDAKVRVFDVGDDERRLVATYPLLDDGTKGDRTPDDGVYTATYAASEKGEYQTDVEVVYGDAGTVVVPAATTYSVKSTLTHVFERNLLWFLLGGALVIALSAFVIVQLMRYGYI